MSPWLMAISKWPFNWKLIEGDIDDNKYVDCAIAARAEYIITQDKHFHILKQIPFPAFRPALWMVKGFHTAENSKSEHNKLVKKEKRTAKIHYL